MASVGYKNRHLTTHTVIRAVKVLLGPHQPQPDTRTSEGAWAPTGNGGFCRALFTSTLLGCRTELSWVWCYSCDMERYLILGVHICSRVCLNDWNVLHYISSERRVCLFLMCGWNRAGMPWSCRWIKDTLKSGKKEAAFAAHSPLVLPALPQTLAHWSLTAPPSTLLTQKDIVQHVIGSERNLHRGMTGQAAFMHGCTVPELAPPQMTDDSKGGIQVVPEPSDSAPCCLCCLSK